MLIFLDTETTGSGPEDRLCQVAFKSKGGKPIEELYNPGRPISIEAMVIHHITNEMVADTREASESVMPIHNRMPVILKPEAFDAWLDSDNQDVNALLTIIQNQIYTELISFPVSKIVNSVRNNSPENIQRIENNDR